MTKTNKIAPGEYERKGNTFTVWDERFMIQNLYGKRLARIKPTFKHVSKLFKAWEDEYFFDVVTGSKKINYMLELLEEKVRIMFID